MNDDMVVLRVRSVFTGARSVARRRQSGRVQRLEKRHQRGRLGGAQVLSVGGHVAATLNHLTYQLILRELNGDAIQFRPALSSRAAKSVAVMALLCLENERPLPLQRCAAFQVLVRNRFAAPRIHHGTPRRIAGQMCECTERDCDQQNRKNRDGPALPAFLAFT